MTTPTLYEAVRFLLVLAALGLPGVLLLRRLAPSLDAPSRIAVGGVLGIALQLVGLMLSAHASLRWHWVIWALAWLAGLAALRGARPLPAHARIDRREWVWLGLVLFCQVTLAAAGIANEVLPAGGGDAVYHVSVAQKYLVTGTWPGDFLPFDPSPPSHPPASHWLVALLARVGGLPVHRSYQLLLVGSLCWTTLLVHALGRGWQGTRVGILSAAVFATATSAGGWALLRGGRVPEALALTLLLAIAATLRLRNRRAAMAVAAVLLGALVQTHLSTTLALAVVWLALIAAAGGRTGVRRRLVLDAARTSVAAALLASPFLVAHVRHLGQRLGSGSAEGHALLSAAGPLLRPLDWVMDLGPLLCGLALVGGWLRWGRTGVPPRAAGRRASGSAWLLDRLLAGWLAGLWGLYMLLDWVLRLLLRAQLGQDLLPLAPARFLADLAHPLSLLAGLALAFVSRRAPALCGALLGLAVASAIWTVAPGGDPSVHPRQLAAMLWVRDNTREDALVLGNHPWLTYVSGREGSTMPLLQEEVSPYTAHKRRLLAEGREAVAAHARETGRPIYLRTRFAAEDPDYELVFEAPGERLYRLRSATAP